MAEGDGDEKASVSTPTVFISYASQDAPIANAVVAALERQGLRCWIAPRDVTPGALYADEIVRAINEATVVVVILSERAVASPHVGKEIERASSKRRRIIALHTDSAPLTRAFEYFLSESQWIEVGPGGIEAAAVRVVEAVPGHLDPSSRAEPRIPAHAPAASRRPATARSIWTVVGGVSIVSVALVYLVVDKFRLAHHSTSDQRATGVMPRVSDRSIAVLPFADMSEKKDQEYFSDGMAEELLDLLAKLPGLRVIGRTSSFQFKGKNEDLRAIGHTLDVTYVVEGSVRKAGDRLRVTAQLIGTSDGSHVWSETYDEDIGDVLKVQDRIAAGLARALQVTIGADDLQASPMLKSSEAYDLYLRGRHALDRFDEAGFESAADYFQQALEIDPSFVRAAEWLATTHEALAEQAFVPPREGFERARASVKRALDLNPNSGIAHSVLALILTIYDWDWAAAADEGKRALALAPRDAQVLLNVGQVHTAVGEWDEAARLVNSSLAVDPLYSGAHWILGNIRSATGRLSEAEAEYRRILQLSPKATFAHSNLSSVLLAEGKLEAALAEAEQETPEGGRDLALASVYHAMGHKADSDAALARFTKTYSHGWAMSIALTHAYRGDIDEAFSWLERAYREKDPELYQIKGSLAFKRLSSDPRYKAFLRKMNLPE